MAISALIQRGHLESEHASASTRLVQVTVRWQRDKQAGSPEGLEQTLELDPASETAWQSHAETLLSFP